MDVQTAFTNNPLLHLPYNCVYITFYAKCIVFHESINSLTFNYALRFFFNQIHMFLLICKSC